MPINVRTVVAPNIKTRWREPFASESMNKRGLGVTAPGIYRGLFIEPTSPPVDLAVTIASDSVTGDQIAVAETSSGFSVHYVNEAGDFNLDLSNAALLNEEVTIALQLVYAVGAETTGVFIAYTQAEWDALATAAKRELVVLGVVSVPNSGTIPLANIATTERTLPWENPSQATAWSRVSRNDSFEVAEGGASDSLNFRYWRTSTTPSTGSAALVANTTFANAGEKSVAVTVTGAGIFDFEIAQDLNIPVEEGQKIRVRVSRRSIAAAIDGTATIDIAYRTVTGALTSPAPAPFSVDAVTAAFAEFEVTFIVPASVHELASVAISGNSIDYAGAGLALLIDSVGVWVESLGSNQDLAHEARGAAAVIGALTMEDKDGVYSDVGAALEFDKDGGSGSGGGVIVVDPLKGSIAPDLQHKGSIIGLGSSTLGSGDNAGRARVSAPASVFAGVEYTLMWESIPVGEKGFRKYVSPTGDMVETVNAAWNNTTNLWTKDVDADMATKQTHGIAGLSFAKQEGGAGTWGDAAWDQEAVSHNMSPAVGTGDEDYSFLQLVREAGGLPTFALTHNGLRDGRVLEFWERWDGANGIPAAGELPHWTTTLDPGSSIFIQEPFSQPFDRSCDIQSDNTIGSQAIIRSYPIISMFNDNTIFTIEWSFFANSASPNADIMMGLVTDFGDETSDRVVFRLDDGNLEYQAQNFDGPGTVTTPTGVSHVGALPVKFKIELRGYDIIGNVGGDPRALFFINDLLVADHTTNVEDTKYTAFFRVESTTNGFGVAEIGPVFMTWTQAIAGNV
jgi:hypothetical protein